jgi:hypothetical protein
VLLQPRGIRTSKLIQGQMHRIQHTFQALERANGGEHMRGVGALGAARLDEAAGFARCQEGILEALRCVVDKQPLPEIVQQREIEARIM